MFIQALVSVYITVSNPALPVAHRDRLEFGTEFFPGYYSYYSFSVARNHQFGKLLGPKKPPKEEKKILKGSNHLIAMAQIFPPHF